MTRRASIHAVSIVVLSALDALFTLLHLQDGGHEINPVMEVALSAGIPTFVAVKLGLTNLGVLFLAAHQNFRLGYKALSVTGVVYAALLIYHAGLILLGPLAS